MKKLMSRCWQFLRAVSTDDAYERYLKHQRQHHPEALLMDRSAFYLHEQQRKWTGVQRCC